MARPIQIRRLHLIILMGMIVFAAVMPSSAFGKSVVDDYMFTHGGCAAISRSWENEFRRPDRAPPYGKPFLDWDQEDFSVLRKWVDQCMDPFLVQRGHRAQLLQMYDARVRQYQQEQERSRAEVRDQQQAETEQDKEFQSLLARYESSRAQTEKTIQDLEAKASALAAQTTNLQLTNIDKSIEMAQEAALVGQKAQSSYSETSKAVSSLTRFAQSTNQRDRLRTKDTEFDQLHTMFDRIQSLNARSQTTLQRSQQIKARWQPCSQGLLAAGVPRPIIETKIFSANGEQDPYLFELICPSRGTRLVFSGPNRSSQLFAFEIGDTPVRLWFDLRNDDGSKMWSQQASNELTATSRLVLRRVSAGSTEESAQANWESVNLLNTAALLMAMSK